MPITLWSRKTRLSELQFYSITIPEIVAGAHQSKKLRPAIRPQLSLPFDAPIPRSKGHRTLLPPVPSAAQQLLDGLDWEQYRTTVLETVRQAVEDYRQRYANQKNERVFQISLWTDPQAQITAINFETKEHAGEFVREWATFWREKGEPLHAEKIERRGYTNNPASFKYQQFRTVRHPELAGMQEIEFYYAKNMRAALTYIKKNLLLVVQRLRDEDILAPLPREETVWIGVNSARDWYDHVRKIENANGKIQATTTPLGTTNDTAGNVS